MEACVWPFEPIHITNDGEKIGGSLAELTGVGIISNAYLQGLQTRISAELGNPTTVIEFSPDGKPVRTDSRIPNMGLREHCRALRLSTNESCCLESDNVHAQLFQGATRSDLEELVAIGLRSNKELLSLRLKHQYRLEFVPAHNGRRAYLEYNCPWLGYVELVFPLFFGERVIGVFFVGEILLQDREDESNEIREKFLTSDRFERSVMEAQEKLDPATRKSPQEVANRIRSCHADIWSGSNAKWTKERFTRLIQATDEHLTEFEAALVRELDAQKRTFIHNVVDSQITAFREALPRTPAQIGEDLAGFWGNLQGCLGGLLKSLSRDFVIVFGVKSPNDDQPQPLSVVASAGDDIPSEIRSLLPTLTSAVPGNTSGLAISSQEDESVFSYVNDFDKYFNRSKSLVRVFPVPLAPQASFVVLVGYKEGCLPTSEERKPDSDFNRALRWFYDSVASALSSVLTSLARKHERDMLRILPHELSQVSAGLDALRFLYFHVKRGKQPLSDKDFIDLDEDIQGFTGQFRLALLNMKHAVRGLGAPPQKRLFGIFGDVIVKWSKAYRISADGYSLRINLPNVDREDPFRPMVYGDPILLEQVVYNLLGNALKYSYAGTNIYVDCQLQDPSVPLSPHLLTVTNFGLWLDSAVDIFSLYGRGRNAEGTEGIGIGLFCVKNIIEAHGGEVSVKVEKISQYNIPLIEPYISRTFSGRQEGRVKDLEEERTRLRRTGRLDQVIALGTNRHPLYDSPVDALLVKTIKNSTSMITFSATIPRS